MSSSFSSWIVNIVNSFKCLACLTRFICFVGPNQVFYGLNNSHNSQIFYSKKYSISLVVMSDRQKCVSYDGMLLATCFLRSISIWFCNSNVPNIGGRGYAIEQRMFIIIRYCARVNSDALSSILCKHLRNDVEGRFRKL